MDNLQTWVTDQDADLYVSYIAYRDVQQNGSTLYWSLESQFAWLRDRGLTYCPNDWYKQFKLYVHEDTGTSGYKMRANTSAPGSTKSDILPIATTRTCKQLRLRVLWTWRRRVYVL